MSHKISTKQLSTGEEHYNIMSCGRWHVAGMYHIPSR